MAMPAPGAPAAAQADAGAAGDGSQQAAGAQAEAGGGEQQAQQPDLTTILDGIGQTLEQQREFLASEPWKAGQDDGGAEEQQQAPPEFDMSVFDESQPGYSPENALEGLAKLIDGRAGQQVQQMFQPHLDRLNTLETNAAIDDLVAKYPQFGEPGVAKQVIENARAWAAQIGQPELGSNPEVYRLMYLAGRSLDAEQRERSAAADGAATLEGAGGASPGGAGQGDALTTESMTAGWKKQGLPLFKS